MTIMVGRTQVDVYVESMAHGSWIGYRRDRDYHYLCLLPGGVIRWPRKSVASAGGAS